MNEKEKRILETIAKALPEMTEFDKGYFLGKAEAIAEDKKRERKPTSDQPNQKTG